MAGTPRHYGARKWHDGPGGHGICKSCGDEIRWLQTPKGKMMPTDAAGVGKDETYFDHTRHTSHFSTCRQADMWRKPWVPQKNEPPGGGSVGL